MLCKLLLFWLQLAKASNSIWNNLYLQEKDNSEMPGYRRRNQFISVYYDYFIILTSLTTKKKRKKEVQYEVIYLVFMFLFSSCIFVFIKSVNTYSHLIFKLL